MPTKSNNYKNLIHIILLSKWCESCVTFLLLHFLELHLKMFFCFPEEVQQTIDRLLRSKRCVPIDMAESDRSAHTQWIILNLENESELKCFWWNITSKIVWRQRTQGMSDRQIMLLSCKCLHKCLIGHAVMYELLCLQSPLEICCTLISL